MSAVTAETHLSREQVAALLQPSGYATLNATARRLALALANGRVTKNQVRNILNSVQAIGETWDVLVKHGTCEREIAKLEPSLVYLAGRETVPARKTLLTGLAETLAAGVAEVLAAAPDHGAAPAAYGAMRARYTALVDLVEAITAYHRLHARGE